MGNFNNNRSERNYSSDNRGFEKPQMHSAICSKCGKSCMVPFKPTGNRPIFCNDCFKTESANLPRRTDERGPQVLTNRSDRQMFDAICDKCGNRCQIPFQPRPGKQVFCSHCFEQKENGRPSQDRPQNNELATLHVKLDKILALLSPAPIEVKTPKKENVEKKIVEEVAANATIEKEVAADLVTAEVAKPVKKAAAKKKASSKKKAVTKEGPTVEA